MKVRLTKLSPCENPELRSAAKEEYERVRENNGLLNAPFSLPTDYYVEGFMHKTPTVGERLFISRINRNGIAVDGITCTSEVQSITEDGFITLNSIYKLEQI